MNRTIPYMSLLALTLLSLGGQACKKNSDSSIKADGDDLKIHIYKGEGSVIDYLKKQSTANPDLGTRVEVIEPEEEGLGWPDYPRTVLETSQKQMADTEIYVGFKKGILDIVEVAGKTNIKVINSTSSDVVLAKHTPNNESLFVDGPNGPSFNLSDGHMYRASCVYSSEAKLSKRFEYSVDLSGNGFKKGEEVESNLKVSSYSGFFDVRPDWTLPDLREFCDNVYVDRVRDVVTGDMVSAMSHWNARESGDEVQKALTVVFHGGNLTRHGLYGHAFHIDKASKKKVNSDHVELSGDFVHSIKGICKDETIQYRCRWANGAKERQAVKFSATTTFCTSKWKGAAKNFVRDICKQGYFEFRNPSQPYKQPSAGSSLDQGVADSHENMKGFEEI